MNSEMWLTIISTVVTAVILPLITLAGNKLIGWLGTKLKNEKAAGYIQKATTIVLNAVKMVFQTYVDSLKKVGGFDEAAQKEALEKCKAVIRLQLTEDVKAFLTEAYGDFEVWMNTQIEASINTLKSSPSAE